MSQTPKTLKCPRCYGDVDIRAKVCPHCNKRFRTGARWHIGSLLMAIALFIIVIGIFLEPVSALIIGGIVMGVGHIIRKD